MEVILLPDEININELQVLHLYLSLPPAAGAVVPGGGSLPAAPGHTAGVA